MGYEPVWVWTEAGSALTIDIYLQAEPSSEVAWVIVDGVAFGGTVACATGAGCLVGGAATALSTLKSSADVYQCVATGCDTLEAVSATLSLGLTGIGEVAGRGLQAAVDAGHIPSQAAGGVLAQYEGMSFVVGALGVDITQRGGHAVLTTEFMMAPG